VVGDPASAPPVVSPAGSGQILGVVIQ